VRRAIHAAVVGGSVGAGVGAVGAASATTKASSVVASLTVAKWVGIVAVAAVVTAGSQVVTRLVSSRPKVARAPSAETAHGTATGPATVLRTGREAPALPPIPDVAPLPEPWARGTAKATPAPGPSEARLPVSASPASSAASVARDDFTEEVAALDAARTTFEAGDLDGTLEKLNRHDLDYPRGHLRPEALAMRIQTYDARHDYVRVRELATRFLSDYPTHPFADRARTLVSHANP
jgi:TolA-binding protein